jgi:hypothetical protein
VRGGGGGGATQVETDVEQSCARKLAKLGYQNLLSKAGKNLSSVFSQNKVQTYIARFLSSSTQDECAKACKFVSLGATRGYQLKKLRGGQLPNFFRDNAGPFAERYPKCNDEMLNAKSYQSFRLLCFILSQKKGNQVQDLVPHYSDYKKYLSEMMYVDPASGGCGLAVSEISLSIIDKELDALKFGTQKISVKIEPCENAFVESLQLVARRKMKFLLQ